MTTFQRFASIFLLLSLGGCVVVVPSDKIAAPATGRLEHPLQLTHSHSDAKSLSPPPFPYMVYYRTELHNSSDRPLKVVWFEGYSKVDNKWRASNVTGKPLLSHEFGQWYTEGDKLVDRYIMPGKSAVVDVNWHGGKTPDFLPMKWAYVAVDNYGNDYFVEAEVDPAILRREAPYQP